MKKALAEIAEKYGTPCYAYDWDAIERRAGEIREAFGGRFRLSYAVKANPNLRLLERLAAVVDSMDISSSGELKWLGIIRWPREKASFTGPGKTSADLAGAVIGGVGHVVVEGLEEAKTLSELAIGWKKSVKILLRISPATMPPGFGVSMAGRPSPFGVDEEQAVEVIGQILRLPGVTLEGFHIYSGTQCLKAEAIVQNYANFIRIFQECAKCFDLRPKELVFGSGLGVPYYPEDQPLDLAAVAAGTNPLLDALKAEPRFADTVLVLELGRYLVGEAGYFLTSVISVKDSRGAKIAICDGGMNHHLAACGHMGTVIPRNYRMFRLQPADASRAADAEQVYEIVGPLCTSIDRLGRKVSLPELRAGDAIAIECSGAYGLTASPVHFISHLPAREVIFSRGGDGLEVEDTESYETFFNPIGLHIREYDAEPTA